MAIRFLTSGESHGKCLNAIIEGIGSGYFLDLDFINNELKNRQKGKGRGGRMKIETDTIEIKSGVRFQKTTGSPICIEIKNKDFENWKIPMSTDAIDFSALSNEEKVQIENLINEKEITRIRPGHADFAGAIKYRHKDIRNILERSSARETAARVAVGAICQDILRNFNIFGEAKTLSVGGKTTEKEIDEIIEWAKKEGESLGGEVEIRFKNLPVGLGSFTHWDRRLDGCLAGAMMSIPAVKAVEIGLGKGVSDLPGSKVHDEIFLNDSKAMNHSAFNGTNNVQTRMVTRKTNNAGGIEGGMTNGEDVIIRLSMKPIPTMRKPLNSINIKTKTEETAHFERADTSAVEALGTVALNMASIILLDAFFEKFGPDNFDETMENFKNYEKYAAKF